MSERYFNPFQGIDVNIPVDFHEDVSRFSQREGKPIIDHSPFPRMVDMWFLAMCVAAAEKLPPADLTKCETRKIIDGNIFSSDPWRVQMLMLVAITQSGDIQIVSEPRKMMTIANGLAIAGLPRLIEMIKSNGGEPIWNISEAIESLIKKSQAA